MKVAKKKAPLGKGIRALLDSIEPDTTSAVVEATTNGNPTDKVLSGGGIEIPLDQIEINPFQPRTEFDPEKLQELADSIKIHGLVTPITVRRLSANKYQLIAGERRFRASKSLGMKAVPAYIRSANDQTMLEMALIENIQRDDLNALEVSISYKRLMDECQLTQEKLAERVGKQRATITNYLRLLKLPPEIQKVLKERKISMGHARALISIDSIVDQLAIFNEVISKGLSVRQTEELVRQLTAPKQTKTANAPKLSPALQNVQEGLASFLSTKVGIKEGAEGKGQIVINYFSDEDLNRLLELIQSE